MTHLIVFDLDGTLVDSRRDLAESANALLAGYGCAPLPLEDVVSKVGDGARVLVDRVLRARGVGAPLDEAVDRFLAIYEQHLVEYTALYPGIRAALDTLAPLGALAVLTNKPARHSRLLLEALEIAHAFMAIVGLDESLPRKPDPAGLLHLVERAGATRLTTIMVGDSPVDAETARRAGTRFCLARYGFGRFDPDAPLAPGAIEVTESRDLAQALSRAIAPAG